MHNKSHNGFSPRLLHFLAVAAASVGSSLSLHAASTTLQWDPSSGADVAGYKVHYGSSSRSYSQVLDVKNTTKTTVSNLNADSTYYFAVTAYNSAGVQSSTSNEVSAKTAADPTDPTDPTEPNQPPVVSLTSPAPGSSHSKRTKITLAATASDADGKVSKVEFFVGNSKIGEDLSAPYTAVWNASQPGSYTLVARATDDGGKATTSQSVVVSVTNAATGGGKKGKTTFTTLIDSAEADTAYAGALSLTTTDSGTYSGKVKYDGVAYDVKGRLGADGTATKKIKRNGKPDLTLTLETTETGELAGSIGDGTTEARFAAKEAIRGGEEAKRNAGTWTILLPPTEAPAGTTAYPQGTSYAKLEINKQGIVRLTGKLSDGSPISQGGRVTEAGVFPVYVPLYGKKGLLAGRIQFPISDTAEKTLSGEIEWQKPQGLKGQKYYPAGFDLTLDVIGQIAPNNPGSENAEDPRSEGTRELTLFAGGLAQPIVEQVTVNAKGNVKPVEGPAKVRLEIRKNGKFSGSFLDPATRKRRNFSGFSLPTQGVGAGFFKGKQETGGVILELSK